MCHRLMIITLLVITIITLFAGKLMKSYISYWFKLLLLCIDGPLVLCSYRFDRSSRQVKCEPVDLAKEEYDLLICQQITFKDNIFYKFVLGDFWDFINHIGFKLLKYNWISYILIPHTIKSKNMQDVCVWTQKYNSG